MSYVIAGRAIKSEFLALGTLLSTAAVAAISMSGDKKEKAKPEAVKIEASSNEEEEFIRNFIAEAEKADKDSKH
ncbi:hypothetical protein Clacol_004580 [Clathrus columnatus]|uniref:Uncharacterized protein n=1 Tax=Clathrus columnatus TaxID=1419009 RepID=A0AAV5AAV1_9AGAM|nr:hypothetical protein Clacol_004580 [Clathrus columnatus]